MLAEEEVSKIEAIFSSPDFYKEYAEQTNELTGKLNKAKSKVKQLYDRWQELEEINSSSN